MKMQIRALWGWRKNADGPELMTAWDEWTVDENRQGWQDECERHIKEWGSDLLSHRYAVISVPYEAIEALWVDAEIEGEAARLDEQEQT